MEGQAQGLGPLQRGVPRGLCLLRDDFDEAVAAGGVELVEAPVGEGHLEGLLDGPLDRQPRDVHKVDLGVLLPRHSRVVHKVLGGKSIFRIEGKEIYFKIIINNK